MKENRERLYLPLETVDGVAVGGALFPGVLLECMQYIWDRRSHNTRGAKKKHAVKFTVILLRI